MLASRARRLIWLPLVALAGCDAARPVVPTPATPGDPAAPAPQPGRPAAEKPDLARLGFDPPTRTLRLYDLPDRGGRWLLATPDRPDGTPVSGTVRLPADLDVDAASVFYTVPDRRPSPRVTLREVADAQGVQAAAR
jgi:hypothetical protein